MTTIYPISQTRHAAKRWQRFSSYAFAADSAVLPLVGAELAKAALAFPIALIRQGEGYVPAAVMGLEPGKNLFVAPDGRWLGSYVPSAVRGYPFLLGNAEDGKQLLCVNEASGLVTDGPEGERFFEDDDRPAQAVKDLHDFFTQVERNRLATAAACAALQAQNLVEAWPIAVKTEVGERRIEGLFRVNETAMTALADEAFLSLRQSGALALAYAQLLSMQHLPTLGKLHEARARAAAAQAPATPNRELDFSYLDSGTIRFH